MKTQNTRIFGNSKQNSKKLVFRLFHLPTRNRSKYRISLAKLRMPEYRWISHESAKQRHIREFNVKLRKSKFFDDFTYQPEIAQNIAFLSKTPNARISMDFT